MRLIVSFTYFWDIINLYLTDISLIILKINGYLNNIYKLFYNQHMIRHATNKDYSALKNIRPNLTDETIRERLEKQAKGEIEYLILDENGQLVSFILLYWHGKYTHPKYPDMVDLYTKKSERGKGYAKQLIAECEKLAKGRGFTKIGMAVNPDLNSPAHQLYLKLGYKHDGGKKYLDGVYDGVEDWVIDLEKEL